MYLVDESVDCDRNELSDDVGDDNESDEGINIQTVTCVEVTIGNCFPDVWEICPPLLASDNISQIEGKQFPIVTDNNRLYLFCYTS